MWKGFIEEVKPRFVDNTKTKYWTSQEPVVWYSWPSLFSVLSNDFLNSWLKFSVYCTKDSEFFCHLGVYCIKLESKWNDSAIKTGTFIHSFSYFSSFRKREKREKKSLQKQVFPQYHTCTYCLERVIILDVC